MSNASPYVECPHCGFTFNDLASHIRIAHPETVTARPRTVLEPYDTVKPARMAERVTAPVTGRKAVYLQAIDTAKRIRALTLDKLRLMDDLIESLHYQIRKEHDDDQARLHRLEQAVQRLEDAAAGRRAAVPDGPHGTPSGTG